MRKKNIALFKFFESEEEYKNFNKKLNVIDNHYNAIGKKYENMKILLIFQC